VRSIHYCSEYSFTRDYDYDDGDDDDDDDDDSNIINSHGATLPGDWPPRYLGFTSHSDTPHGRTPLDQ
jgi:hypothetical protein